MTPQLSLHSPETTGVTHRSMWLPSVVRGLASVLSGQRDEAKGVPEEPGCWGRWCGVVEGIVSHAPCPGTFTCCPWAR